MKLDKLRTLRDGHRNAIIKRLQEAEDDSSDTRKRTTCLKTIERRVETLTELDEKILEESEMDDIGEEIVAAEDFMVCVEIRISKLKEMCNITDNTNSNTSESRSRPLESSYRSECQPPELERNDTDTNTNSISEPHLSNRKSAPSHCQRLPKLTLPLFNGNILEWQTFWDTYESSIHSNESLTNIQKFNYLKSLLEDTAASAIEGLPLTHANYQIAVELLHERFGQKHKLVHAYMQSLLELPRPVGNVNSLRNFHDKLESYIRGLESLGQCQDTFGSLLVPVVIEKLPAETRRNMTRENGSSDWQLSTLRQTLKKEIAILESGLSTHTLQPVDYSSTFYTGTGERPKRATTFDVRPVSTNPRTFSSAPRPFIQCAFCTENHAPVHCHRYPDAESRRDVIKRDKLCFNCLGKHIVSHCTSRRRCQKCHKKHHTSICQTNAEKASASKVKSSTLNTNAVPFAPSDETRINSRSTASSSAFSTISQSAGLH